MKCYGFESRTYNEYLIKKSPVKKQSMLVILLSVMSK